MDTAIELFATNPSLALLLALLIGAITLIVFFVIKDYHSREKQFEAFEVRFTSALSEFKTYSSDLEVTLKEESIRIAKEVRRLEELMFRSKVEVREEASVVTKQLSKLEGNLMTMTAKIQLTTETLNERFAVVEKLNKQSEQNYGKIKILEDTQGEHWKVISKLAEVVGKK